MAFWFCRKKTPKKYCLLVTHVHEGFYKCWNFSGLQVRECVSDTLSSCVCVCVCSRLCVGVKLCWVTRACVLSHLDLFGPNKRGPCLSGQSGLRAMNRRCLLTTHTWAPPSLGPTSLSIAFSIHRASYLSFFHYPLYPRHFSPRPWPGLLLPLPLWTFWCWLCWPFPQIMCMFANGPFAQSSVCLWIYISQTGYVVDGLQREVFSLMY